MSQEINKPTVLIKKDQAIRNIASMAEKALKSSCEFRPHFKTHQSAEIGEWFRHYKVDKIAVSSVDMAEYFSHSGWRDISICVPVNLRQISRINTLASQIKLHLLVESLEAVSNLVANLENPMHLWIEIDTGYHRSGVDFANMNLIGKMLELMKQSKHINFRGILTHSGHSYHSKSKEQIKQVYSDTLEKMTNTRHGVEAITGGKCAISIGDTPICSTIDSLDPVIDEIRPGNFIFFDVMQLTLGTCKESEIALGVACPIIAKYPERGEFIIYGGAVHLSKEALHLENKTISYGLVCPMKEDGWGESIPDVRVIELTQEHGKIKAPRSFIDSVQIGEMVIILPVHSCLTANLFRHLQTIEGDQLACFRI